MSRTVRQLAVVAMLAVSVDAVEAECRWGVLGAALPGQPARVVPYWAPSPGAFATRADCEDAVQRFLDREFRRGTLLASAPACFCDSEPIEPGKLTPQDTQ